MPWRPRRENSGVVVGFIINSVRAFAAVLLNV
jgi:hypothetical protein